MPSTDVVEFVPVSATEKAKLSSQIVLINKKKKKKKTTERFIQTDNIH